MSSYTVESGDTLSQIAVDLGVPLGALIEANPGIANPNKIKPGQKIEMPNTNPGSTSTVFDTQTPPNWKAPFSMFPSPMSMGPTSTELEGRLQPMANTPSPEAADGDKAAKPYNPLVEASQKARDELFADPRRAAEWAKKFFTERVPAAMRGEMSQEDMVKLGMDTAMMMIGGGSAASAKFGTGPKVVKAAENPMLAEPLPEGATRHLPSQKKGTGRIGLQQRAAKAGAIGEQGMDPMWYDSVINGVEAGALKNTPDQVFNTTTLGSNIIRPDFSKGKPISADPKANLERRLARRGQGNQVITEGDFHSAKAVRYADEAAAERSAGLYQKDMDKLNTAIAKYGSVDKIPDHVAASLVTKRDPKNATKFSTLQDDRFNAQHPEIEDPTKMRESINAGVRAKLATKGETKGIRKLMDIHKELAKGKITKEEAVSTVEEKIRQLQLLMGGDKLPDFP